MLSVSMHMQNLVKIHSIDLKILRSFKGRNSVINRQKLRLNNPKLDVVNIYIYAKFGKNPFICSQDIERNQNFDINQGPWLCNELMKMDT